MQLKILIASVISTIWIAWKLKNLVIFEGKAPSRRQAIITIWSSVKSADSLDTGTMKNSISDLIILKHFNIVNRTGSHPILLRSNRKLLCLVG